MLSLQSIHGDNEEKDEVAGHNHSDALDFNNEQKVIFKRKNDESAGSGLTVKKKMVKRDEEQEGEHENPVSALNAGIMLSRGKKLLSLAKLKRTRSEVSSQNNSRVFNKSTIRRPAEDQGKQEARLKAVQELDQSLLIKTNDKPIGSGTFGNFFLAMY